MSRQWSARAAAAKAVAGVVTQKRSLSTTLPQATNTLEPADRALAQEISYGVLRHFFQLQAISKKLLKRPFKSKDGDLHALVLGGIYQLHFMRTPHHAVISESVNAARIMRKEWARGVVNAVLRRFQREQEELMQAGSDTPVVKYNHPSWIIEQIRKGWPDEWEQILLNNNQRPPMTLRINQQRVSRDDYLQKLDGAGIEATADPNSAVAINLAKGVPVSRLPDFEAGESSVQDCAPQQAAILLGAQPNERVLDACAAPGGKTAHILEETPGIGEVVAVDNKGDRLERLEENMGRLGLTVTAIKGDLSGQQWWDGNHFDRILVDAPCSATGVIRRNPDIKLLRRKEDIRGLVKVQCAILESCWGMLRQGGSLLYATCSVFPEENEEQIQSFLARHANATIIPIKMEWGRATGAGRQLLPGDHGMDGFYYAHLLKQSSASEEGG